MARTTTEADGDDAQIRDLISDKAVETVATRTTVASPTVLDTDDLWAAVEDSVTDWRDVAGDMYEKYVNHGEEYGTPSVICEDDGWVMFYVSIGEWDATGEHLADMGHDEEVASAVRHVYNEQARRYNADPNALGAMDALAVKKDGLPEA